MAGERIKALDQASRGSALQSKRERERRSSWACEGAVSVRAIQGLERMCAA